MPALAPTLILTERENTAGKPISILLNPNPKVLGVFFFVEDFHSIITVKEGFKRPPNSIKLGKA